MASSVYWTWSDWTVNGWSRLELFMVADEAISKNDDRGRSAVAVRVKDGDKVGAELVLHDIIISASILDDATRSTMANASGVFC